MAERLVLTIISTKGVVYEGEVDECYVPSTCGPVGILKGHTPFITSLKKVGILKFTSRSVLSFYVIKNGAVEVRGERLIVLTTEAICAKSSTEAEQIIEEMNK